MDFRFSQFEIITGASTVLLCLFFAALFTEVGAIENEVAADVSAVVDGPDLYWASVEVSGQDVTLTGTAVDVPARNAAVARAAAIPGVSSVDNQIQVIGAAGTCQQELDNYLSVEMVRFKTGKASIADSSYPMLDRLAMIVRSCGTQVEIAGHTDGQGDAQVNLKLSQRRADVVAKELVRRGVLAERLRAVGYGETQPVADNATTDGRKQNRRIEFRVLGTTANTAVRSESSERAKGGEG